MQLMVEETPLEKAIRETMPACDLVQVEIHFYMTGLQIETEPAYIAGINSRVEQIMTNQFLRFPTC